MARYVAKHVPEDSDDVDHEWLVEYEDGDRLVELTGLRAAEANIIAFALNAVAEGHRLASFDDTDTGPEGIEAWNPYEGPTEGVAP